MPGGLGDGALQQILDELLGVGVEVGEGVGGGPDGAVVEVGLVTEAEGGVADLEFVGALEEADDVAVFGPGGHAVPGAGGEGGGDALDEGVDALGHEAVGLGHFGDFGEEVGFAFAGGGGSGLLLFELFGALLHGAFFLGGEAGCRG